MLHNTGKGVQMCDHHVTFAAALTRSGVLVGTRSPSCVSCVCLSCRAMIPYANNWSSQKQRFSFVITRRCSFGVCAYSIFTISCSRWRSCLPSIHNGYTRLSWRYVFLFSRMSSLMCLRLVTENFFSVAVLLVVLTGFACIFWTV